MKKILVLGSSNADLRIRTDRMPKLGETINGFDFTIQAGGKGLNQAVAIKKLGGDVSFFSALGNDSNGKMLEDSLIEYGVDFVGFKSDTVSTGTAIVTVVDGNNFIILNAGANALISKNVIKEAAPIIAQSDYLVLQLEIPMESILEAVDIAKFHHTQVILNPAPFSTLPDEIYKSIDFLIPNEHEAESIVGFSLNDNESCIKAVDSIMNKGVKNVIVTLGRKGCVYRSLENKFSFCDALPTKVVDTTSAGDTFIGAFVTKLSEGAKISEAIAFATKAASITVSRSGASRSIPYAYELSL